MAYLGEVGDHLLALRAVCQQGTQGGGYVFGGEAVLEELGDDAAASNEVDHGNGQIAVGIEGSGDLGWIMDEAFCQPKGERGDAVDDHEGVSDDRSLDGGGSAGDDAGAGVVEGFAGVRDQVCWRACFADVFACRYKLLDPFTFKGGGDRDNVLVTIAERGGRGEHSRKV